MWILVSAVVTASLLGSTHCVGMCGPLAIWASGAGEHRSRRHVALAGGMYHLGRCVTYVAVGLVAGAIGSAVDAGGELVGLQVAAARVAGVIMVTLGGWKLWSLAGLPIFGRRPLRPSSIGGILVKLRPFLFRLPPTGRAFASGLVTTLLPCGWLYLFALVAAGTGSVLVGPVVMFAFWIGTVPALTALIAGTRLLSRKFTRVVPAAAAVLLITTGCYTASGRGFANLEALAGFRAVASDNTLSTAAGGPLDAAASDTGLVDQVQRAGSTPLPCCQAADRSTAKLSNP